MCQNQRLMKNRFHARCTRIGCQHVLLDSLVIGCVVNIESSQRGISAIQSMEGKLGCRRERVRARLAAETVEQKIKQA